MGAFGLGLASIAFVFVLPACGLILDLDHGALLSQDASLDANTPELRPDATTGPVGDSEEPATDAPATTDASGASDAMPVGDGGADADGGPSECTPDPAWCDSHCGTGPDNCGESRQCA